MQSRFGSNYGKFGRPPKRRQSWLILTIGLSLAAVVLLVAGAVFSLEYILGSRRESVFTFYPELSRDQVNVMMGGEIVQVISPPLVEGGNILLPVDFINQHISPYMFWDRQENIIITDENSVRRYRLNELDYRHNNQPRLLDEAFVLRGDMAYIPMAFVKAEYNVIISYHEEYSIVTVDDAGQTRSYAILASDGRLRSRPNRHSPYIEEVHQGDVVLLLSDYDADGFRRVRSANAISGYVQLDLMGEVTVVDAVLPMVLTLPDFRQPLTYPIVLLWDVLFNNRTFWDVAPQVTILSPAWFYFQFENGATDGTIVDHGNRDYVAYAHANGRMVWPKITDNFNSIVSHTVLSNTEIRENVVQQIIDFVRYYNLDGINVDYEAVLPADAPYFIQFLRELRPPMRELGAYLSVALFVPRYTMFMNRTEIAKTVDYVAVMTYDEHWWNNNTQAGAGPGPVAPLPFVSEGIAATMNEVPGHMILMGLPFYNRVWRIATDPDGSTHTTIRNIGMNYARRMFTENGATFTWLYDIGSYFAEFADPVYPNVTHKIWLECERSIERKLRLAAEFNLPGVAAWRGGLENQATWDVIAQYIQASGL